MKASGQSAGKIAETHVRRFEALALKQQEVEESRRDKKKLAKALAAAVHYANVSNDNALRKRVVKAARPLIRASSLFAMRGPEWAISLEGKAYSLSKCIDSCRANNPPGIARELCEAGCALWIMFCGGSELPDRF